MTNDAAERWLTELISRTLPVDSHADPRIRNGFRTGIQFVQASKIEWAAEAASALQAVLPPSHASIRAWSALEDRAKDHGFLHDTTFHDMRGVLRAVKRILSDGHLSSLFDGVRADTVGDVLDQALALLLAKHSVAAAVLAGGALETHLHHICEKYLLTWSGDGSISKYEGALAKSRNAGVEIISGQESKQVTAWGGLRNDAAHDPTQFAHSDEEVRRMIEGVRDFVVRHP